jgi:hypothetical protein
MLHEEGGSYGCHQDQEHDQEQDHE